MAYQEWKDKTSEFKKIDVRGVAGNFFPGLKKQALVCNLIILPSIIEPVFLQILSWEDMMYISRHRDKIRYL